MGRGSLGFVADANPETAVPARHVFPAVQKPRTSPKPPKTARNRPLSPSPAALGIPPEVEDEGGAPVYTRWPSALPPRPARRRRAAPNPPNPTSIRLQVAGSGADAVRNVPDAELRVTPVGRVNPIFEVFA
jgi:hypothetical protein